MLNWYDAPELLKHIKNSYVAVNVSDMHARLILYCTFGYRKDSDISNTYKLPKGDTYQNHYKKHIILKLKCC